MAKLLEWLTAIMRVAKDLPSLRSMALALAMLIVLFVVVRILVVSRADDPARARAASRRKGSAFEDPWTLAESLIGEGRYEEAAHALYRAVIFSLSRTDKVRVDPSKTSGDYARELRRRGSPSLSAFRAFTRRFDAVVYGNAGATAMSLDELRRLSVGFHPSERAA